MAVLGAALAWGAAAAQDNLAMGQVQSLILTVDVDRLFAETRFGQRLNADLLARGDALAAENRRIEAELTAEEQALTERRPSMEPEAFRAEADDFDARVQSIRAEQDAKQRALEEAVAEGRDAIFEAAEPALAQLMMDSGAVVVLERRDVVLSASLVDITDEAIAAIDAGADAPAEPPPADAPPVAPGVEPPADP